MEKKFIGYLPHGIDHRKFFKPTSEEDLAGVADMKKRLFGEDEVEFVVLFNNRNIRRKMTGDVVLAHQVFFNSLPKDKAAKTRFVLHTQPVDENGTDLVRLIHDLAPEIKHVFSGTHIDTKQLNYLYAASDVLISLTSNEGFGLTVAEAIMCEKMTVLNVTGGMQDQMGFTNDAGELIHEDRDLKDGWGSNHDGRFRNHGEWVLSCFPTSRSLQGSPPTPYIFDDRCDWEEAGRHLRTIYDMPKAERERRGKLGREYLLSNGFSADEMNRRFIESMNTVFEKWIPRHKFDLIKA